MRRRLAVIFAVVFAAVIGVIAWSSPWKSSLPPFHKATVSFPGQKEETVVELSLGQQEELHDLLSGIPRDRMPKKWQVFGTVRLFDSAGSQVSQIEVYSNPTGLGPLRIGKHYFLGYDQTAFREMLEQ